MNICQISKLKDHFSCSFENYHLIDIPLSITVVSSKRIFFGSSFDSKRGDGGDLEIGLAEYCEVPIHVDISAHKIYVLSCIEIQ